MNSADAQNQPELKKVVLRSNEVVKPPLYMSYNILLIEDNLEMADNISDLLELAHYKVTHAPNGKTGVEL